MKSQITFFDALLFFKEIEYFLAYGHVDGIQVFLSTIFDIEPDIVAADLEKK